jgi:integrase
MAFIKRLGKDKEGILVWEVSYRRTKNGKLIHRHIHALTKQEAERQIALDTARPDVSLKWSEGLKIYVAAKHAEKRNPVSIGHGERAVDVFIQLIGDISIESTDANTFKHFLQLVANGATVRDFNKKEYKTGGPGVANHHRKELVTIANYLKDYSGKVTAVPFSGVPSLPVKDVQRLPIPESELPEYLDALQPHVRRPVLMVLLYGLRSTAICNITPADVKNGHLTAIDKGEVTRRIPIDDTLAEIIEEAAAHRSAFPNPADRLFVNKKGAAWNHVSLLRAAQRFWKAAGLEKKKIHEVRHTLGTMAGKNFTLGMVQAAMGHRSRASSEVYFHPDEEMASTVRQKIVTKLYKNTEKTTQNQPLPSTIIIDWDEEKGEYPCPCCSHNLLIVKEKGRKP